MSLKRRALQLLQLLPRRVQQLAGPSKRHLLKQQQRRHLQPKQLAHGWPDKQLLQVQTLAVWSCMTSRLEICGYNRIGGLNPSRKRTEQNRGCRVIWRWMQCQISLNMRCHLIASETLFCLPFLSNMWHQPALQCPILSPCLHNIFTVCDHAGHNQC